MSTQNVIEDIEGFCEQILRLKAFYCSVSEFTQSPISKAQAAAFIDNGIRNVFASNDDINKVLVKLTINPSELNADNVCELVTSHRYVGVRRFCLALSATAKRLILEVLKVIKSYADGAMSIPGETSIGKVVELKRCVLMLPLIFKSERDVSLLQEQLIELPVCEEELKKDIDTLLLSTKEYIENAFCKVYLDEKCCHSVINEKNWQSVKSVVARAVSVSAA